MQRFGCCPFFKRSRDPPSKLAEKYSKREWRISTLLKDHPPPTNNAEPNEFNKKCACFVFNLKSAIFGTVPKIGCFSKENSVESSTQGKTSLCYLKACVSEIGFSFFKMLQVLDRGELKIKSALKLAWQCKSRAIIASYQESYKTQYLLLKEWDV